MTEKQDTTATHVVEKQSNPPLLWGSVWTKKKKDLIMGLSHSGEQSLWQMCDTVMKLKQTFDQEGRQPPHTRFITANFSNRISWFHFSSILLRLHPNSLINLFTLKPPSSRPLPPLEKKYVYDFDKCVSPHSSPALTLIFSLLAAINFGLLGVKSKYIHY